MSVNIRSITCTEGDDGLFVESCLVISRCLERLILRYEMNLLPITGNFKIFALG